MQQKLDPKTQSTGDGLLVLGSGLFDLNVFGDGCRAKLDELLSLKKNSLKTSANVVLSGRAWFAQQGFVAWLSPNKQRSPLVRKLAEFLLELAMETQYQFSQKEE